MFVATNIKWDTDGDLEIFESLPQRVELPKERFCRENYIDEDGEYDEYALAEDASDFLSEEYGFCHAGFDLEECEDE